MAFCVVCGAQACGVCPVCRGAVCGEHWLGGEGDARLRWISHESTLAGMMTQAASGDQRLAAEWVSRMFEEGVFGDACTKCWQVRFDTLTRTVPVPPPMPSNSEVDRAYELLRRHKDPTGTVPVATAVQAVESIGLDPERFEYYETRRTWTGSKRLGPFTGERWVTGWSHRTRSGWGPSGGEHSYLVPGRWFTRSVYVPGDGTKLDRVPYAEVESLVDDVAKSSDPTRRWINLAPPVNSILALAARRTLL